MEDVLDVYERPYDPRRPQVCLDETSKQLVGEVRTPLPPAPGQPVREDYEYVRNGVANLFLVTEPLRGWRQMTVTAQRTAVDFAQVIKELVDVRYPEAERIVLVLDNRNTHTPSALYAAFPPAEAHRLNAKLEWHYTPKHGSWLNMAEIEFSVLARQCLDRRLPDRATVEDLHFYYERGLVRNGYAWVFPCGESVRIGVCSFDAGVSLGPILAAHLARFGLQPGRTHGGVLATRPRPPLDGARFVVGDAAGQCLPAHGGGHPAGDRLGRPLRPPHRRRAGGRPRARRGARPIRRVRAEWPAPPGRVAAPAAGGGRGARRPPRGRGPGRGPAHAASRWHDGLVPRGRGRPGGDERRILPPAGPPARGRQPPLNWRLNPLLSRAKAHKCDRLGEPGACAQRARAGAAVPRCDRGGATIHSDTTRKGAGPTGAGRPAGQRWHDQDSGGAQEHPLAGRGGRGRPRAGGRQERAAQPARGALSRSRGISPHHQAFAVWPGPPPGADDAADAAPLPAQVAASCAPRTTSWRGAVAWPRPRSPCARRPRTRMGARRPSRASTRLTSMSWARTRSSTRCAGARCRRARRARWNTAARRAWGSTARRCRPRAADGRRRRGRRGLTPTR